MLWVRGWLLRGLQLRETHPEGCATGESPRAYGDSHPPRMLPIPAAFLAGLQLSVTFRNLGTRAQEPATCCS